jgi:predicted HD phosphohydrolase
MASAGFVSLESAAAEDWAEIIARESGVHYGRRTAALLWRMLEEQRDDDDLGAPVNVYRHSLQTASRAKAAGEPAELVVAALFHDAAEKLAPLAHGSAIADILGPFVGESTEWILRHHPAFQLHHFARHPSADRDARDAFADSPHFSAAARFCAAYDQQAFDPAHPALPLEAFKPLVDAYFESFDRLDRLRHPASPGPRAHQPD